MHKTECDAKRQGLNHDVLLSSARAQALDKEANDWGLNNFALVEAAGRACAQAFVNIHPATNDKLTIVVLAGKGNNAADALVMLKALILSGYAQEDDCSVYTVQILESSRDQEKTPLSEAMLSVQKLGVPVSAWNDKNASLLNQADFIIDGITGTGLTSPLRGIALEMTEAVNAANKPYIVSIDIPSGNFNGWQSGMSIVSADITLAIEPQKICLYAPSSRQYSGTIVPVCGIFPPALIEKYREADLVKWNTVAIKIPSVSKTAYKYERGLVEIRAGSLGAMGAALLSAQGAQSAGAGLVRLIVDPSLYPIVAPNCSGIMTVPDGENKEENRFTPDAVLLGPGWGRGEDRMRILEKYLPLEKQGLPLILDADAIALAKNITFNGNVLITPHAGEFATYTGLSKDEILNNTIQILRHFAKEKNVYILFKSHVLYVAAPDGRIGIIDGMNPVLGAGGSGDALAGFCASIAARWKAAIRCCAVTENEKPFDMYTCACAAAGLLIEAGKSENIAGTFIDPEKLTTAASVIAGNAWLPKFDA